MLAGCRILSPGECLESETKCPFPVHTNTYQWGLMCLLNTTNPYCRSQVSLVEYLSADSSPKSPTESESKETRHEVRR